MSNIPIYNDCKNGIKEPDYVVYLKNIRTYLWNYYLSGASDANSSSLGRIYCWRS